MFVNEIGTQPLNYKIWLLRICLAEEIQNMSGNTEGRKCMADENTEKIYLWPDNTWVRDSEVDDLDWYIVSGGKSDDFAQYNVPSDLDDEDIDELIGLRALPGMIPTKIIGLEDQGKVQLPDDSIIVLEFPMTDVPFVTHINGKMIINVHESSIEILKGK